MNEVTFQPAVSEKLEELSFDFSRVRNLPVIEKDRTLEQASLNGYLDQFVTQIVNEKCVQGWARAVTKKMFDARMGVATQWIPQLEIVPKHTTIQSLQTAEVTCAFYDALSSPLSGFGGRMLLASIKSSPLPYEEKLIRKNSVFELAQLPKLREDIQSLAKGVEKLSEDEKKMRGRQSELKRLREKAENLPTDISDPLIAKLCEKVKSYFSQQILTDYLALDLNAELVPNRFAKNPNALIRLNPIYADEALAATFLTGLLGAFLNAIVYSSESGASSMFADGFLWVSGSLWVALAGVAGVEGWYQAKVDNLFTSYHKGLFQTKEFEDMVGALGALEELCALGRLAACPGAKKSNLPGTTEHVALNNLEDPLAKLQKKSTVPVSVNLSPDTPLLLNGQNGGGKTYICGVLIRTFTVDAIGGPVFADDPVLPDVAFWAMQSPKQESNGNHGRLGSEADTSSYLLERAENAKGPAILIFDEVGQGTSREGTEEATKRVLGEAAANQIYVLHPTHELPLARRLYKTGLVDAMQVKNSGKKVTHGFIPGVADSSGAHLIATKVGYSPEATEQRVRTAGGDVELFNQWAEAGDSLNQTE